MQNVDLANNVLAIVAVAAIVSPAITAIVTGLLNHWHELRMKKLEYEHADKIEREAHEREIYEDYIRAAGTYIQCRSIENSAAFGNHSALIAYHVPEDMRNEIFELESLMTLNTDNARELRTKKLNYIITRLRDMNKPL